MKLRLYDDWVRLQISPAEIETLRHHRAVVGVTHFGGGSRIEYGIEINQRLDEVRETFSDGRLRIEVPAIRAKEWTETDEVGIRHRQALPEGGWLKILIEKDFECLHAEESEPGVVLFPNPNQKC